MAERYARGIAVLLCLLAVPSPASAQDEVATADRSAVAPGAMAAKNFIETITDGVKSVVSCSTFLKTTFEGWARIGGQEWVLAEGGVLLAGAIR